MTAAKQTKPQVPLKDFHTIQYVAALIQVIESAVRDLAYREQDLCHFGACSHVCAACSSRAGSSWSGSTATPAS